MAPGNSLNCLAEPHANANITIIIAHGPQTMTKAIARPVASELPPPSAAVNPKPDSQLVYVSRLDCSRMPPPSAVPRDAQLPLLPPVFEQARGMQSKSITMHLRPVKKAAHYMFIIVCCLAAHTL